MAPEQATPGEVEQSRGHQANITTAPLTEDERQDDREREHDLGRPFPWLAVAAALVLLGLAIVAGLVVGWQYAIAVGVLALVILVFVGGHRALSLAETRRYDSPGPAKDAAADDAGSPVPNVGFDEQSQLGSTAQLSDEEQAAHADMDRSTGQG